MLAKKIAMLGMWGVGKTSLVQQFVHSLYSEKYLSTLGVKVDKKIVSAAGQDLTMMLWDIAGAEDHFSVPVHYIKGSAGYLLVLDGTRRESLEAGMDLVKLVEEQVGSLPFVAAVNKSDLPRQFSDDEVITALEPYQCTWFPTSARTGLNVEAAFVALAERVV